MNLLHRNSTEYIKEFIRPLSNRRSYQSTNNRLNRNDNSRLNYEFLNTHCGEDKKWSQTAYETDICDQKIIHDTKSIRIEICSKYLNISKS